MIEGEGDRLGMCYLVDVFLLIGYNYVYSLRNLIICFSWLKFWFCMVYLENSCEFYLLNLIILILY